MTASGACRATASGTDLPPDAPLPAERRDRSASRGRPPRLASRISTAARRLAAAGLLVLAGLAAGLTVSGEARAQTEVYSGTMTVEDIPNFASGYSLVNLFGSISPSTFSHGGASFTVTDIFTITASLTTGFSWTGTPTFASTYSLCLDGNRVRTGTAANVIGSVSGTSLTRNFSGTFTRPAWTDGQKVEVKLVEGSTCPAVSATASLSGGSVTDTTARLTIGNHAEQWWHKRTSPTTGAPTCQGPVAMGTTTADLSGLTPGTSYTWKAYSATGCASANELATARFRTPKAVATATAHDTATLRVTNHPSTWYYKAGSGNCSTAQSGNSASLTGLTAETAYTYKTYSESTCTTLLATAAEFTTPEQTVTGFTLTVASATSLTANWTAVPGANHYVQWKSSGQSYNFTDRQSVVVTSPYTISSLTTGTEYTVRVRALVSTGNNQYQEVFSPELTATPAVDTGPLDVVLQTTELAVCEDPDHESCPDDDVVAQGEEAQGSAGSSEAYTVRLNKQPTGDVTVKVLEHSPRLTVSPKTLTFTTTNWNQNQQVLVTAVQDDIAWEEDGQIVKIRHLRSGGGRRTGISRHKVTATVYDDDTASVIIGTEAMMVAEDGSGKYTIRITSQPRGREYVQVKSSVWIGECWTGKQVFPSTAGAPAKVSGATFRTTSRFTAQNWRALRYVTVHGIRDRLKDGNRTAKICHETTAGSYYGKPVEDIDLTVTDADAAGISGDVNTLMPPGARMGWWIRVTGPAPKGNVTLEFRSSDQAVAKVDMDPGTPGDQNELTITPQNHRQNHLVRIRSIADGTAMFTVHGAGATTLADAPIASDLANTVVGSVRVCTGANYKGGVGRCPDDPGYSRGGGGDDTPPPVHFLWPPLFGDTLNVDGPAQSATVGAPFSYTAPEATDENDGDTITYTAALSGGGALPDWLGFDAATRTFSGTPGAGDVTAAALAVVMTATDDGESQGTPVPLSGTWSFALSVSAATNEEPAQDEEEDVTTGDVEEEQAPQAPPAATPPTAEAGANLVGKRGGSVKLKGSGTKHAEGSQDALTYSWRIAKASHPELKAGTSWLTDADKATAIYSVPRRKDVTDRRALDDGQTVQFELTVTDGDGETATDTVTMKIKGTTWKVVDLSVADASAREDAGALAFKVSLSEASRDPVKVSYATSDGTARAGSDYTAASGTLTFQPGETEKTVSVTILDDAHDENRETLTLTLSNPDPAKTTKLKDATATGTIINSDPLQRDWLSRFGRSAASQTIGAVTARLALPPDAAPHVTLGGHRVPVGLASRATSDVVLSAEGSRGGTAALSAPGDVRTVVAHRWRVLRASHPELMVTAERRLSGADRTEASYRVPTRDELSDASVVDDGAWVEFERASLHAGGDVSRTTLRLTVGGDAWMPEGGRSAAFADPALAGDGEDGPDGSGLTGRELLLASSFLLSPDATGQGGRWTAWGRAGVEHVSGTEGGLAVDGKVTAGVFGLDRESGRWLAGVALTFADGEGEARGASGTYGLESDVTAVSPYLRVRLSDRLSAWGLAGAGRGAMEVTMPDGETRQRADLRMTLAALGGRAELVPEASGGFGLALRGDAFRVRTRSDAVDVDGVGSLAAASGAANRLRVAVEAWRTVTFSGGSTLRPMLEAGLRRDGGDAGAGTGIEIGGRLAWSDPGTGLAADLAAHRIVARADGDGDEWGMSVGIRLSPDARGRGPSAALTASRGPAAAGADGVWSARGATDLMPGTSDEDARLDAEFGYGTAVRGTNLTGTPYAGLGTGGDGRKWRLGWRLSRPGEAFRLSLDADRSDNGGDPAHGIGLRLDTRW